MGQRGEHGFRQRAILEKVRYLVVTILFETLNRELIGPVGIGLE